VRAFIYRAVDAVSAMLLSSPAVIKAHVRSNIRLVISFAIACVGGLATALFVLPATAGTNSWTAIGPVAYPFAVDPSSPSTIYAMVNGPTVTKTTDGGGHWADLATFEFGPVNALVIDPASPATIYAAVGLPWDYDDFPIYKSIDGGAHWTAQPDDAGRPTGVLAIAPSMTSTLYAGQNDVVLKSIDGGLSWAVHRLLGFSVSALAIDPTNANAVYVALQVAAFTGGPDPPGTIFKSTDGGEQWREVPIAVPAGAVISSLAIDPATPSIVYAAHGPFGAGKSGVLKSIDAGETWIAAQSGLPDTILVNALAIDPSAPARIYAATDQGVFRSTDAAASWTPINAGLTNLHIWSLSIDRTGSLLRAATAGGLFEYQVAELPHSGTIPVIEYFYAAFDHYFITSSPDEISKLDSEGPTGWVRTGYQFNAYAAPNENSAPVCRFFSSASFAPKSSHFYTPFAAECAIRQADPAWTLEKADAFDITLPAADGSCAAGLTPVYRLYNNGQGGAPNHRYTTDLMVRAQMISQGWAAEGLGSNAVEMCSPP
jgi:photosystem II stability/assembly factor-like uncharacterized protein